MALNQKTVKGGGTSVANADKVKQFCGTVLGDPSVQFAVVSAPAGITDTLFALRGDGNTGKTFEENFKIVHDCYTNLAAGLGAEFDPEPDLKRIYDLAVPALGKLPKKDELVSRGEYLCAKIIAPYSGFELLDATRFMRFDEMGEFDLAATQAAWQDLNLDLGKRYVIPGFYGVMPNGTIKLLSRNASDLTGSVVAACAGSSVFEKWTNMSGIYRADPAIVEDAEIIDELTFEELREFTDMGSKVLHPGVTAPLREAGIPMRVRNVDRPEDASTWIVPEGKAKLKPPGTIIGVSHKRNCIIVDVKKFMMNTGYAARVLTAFADERIDVGHISDGTDIMSMTVAAEHLENGKLASLKERLKETCHPDTINLHYNVAVLRVVGHWMNGVPGTAGKVHSALGDAGISNKVHGQPTSEIGMFIAVDEDHCTAAVRAIYERMIRKK